VKQNVVKLDSRFHNANKTQLGFIIKWLEVLDIGDGPLLLAIKPFLSPF
jgi:hypothetical protein